MKKKLLAIFVFWLSIGVTAQEITQIKEQYPTFPACKAQTGKSLEDCFNTQLQDYIYQHFVVPEDLKSSGFIGNVIVLFEVSSTGVFKTLYVDAADERLRTETQRIFSNLPQVEPALYNGQPNYAKYTAKIAIPLKSAAQIAAEQEQQRLADAHNYSLNKDKELTEYDNVRYHKFNNPKFESALSIPFSHSYYAWFDAAVNQLGSNNHTAIKPLSYADVNRYYKFREENQKLLLNKTSWWGKKLFNENFAEIQGDGYWFAFNPILDLQMGKSSPSEFNNTYINTRALQIQGGLGRQIVFTSTIYETQGRFADYYNRYATSIKPSGGDPAVIPGIGIAKSFKGDAFDMPMAEANITFTPSEIFSMQAGYGRNFIGDGYRSLITTDGVSPYPFFKLSTTFWKIRYTNTYMFLKDISPEFTADRTYATKYMANHYLSWNATKRLNLGFFETVIWANTNGRGFDMSFFNPIIFYRSVEFASSAKSGNALMGLTAKYKWNNQFNFYGQFLLDEFSLADIKKAQKSWKNKYGYQVGVKYFNAFNIENLLLQMEYNRVRPYVYSHSDPSTNYGHSNQNIGHQWGANFQELVLIGRYHKGRYFADAKFTYGERGFDFNTVNDSFNYGGNIYNNYNIGRPYDIEVKVGQGNKTKIFIADIQAGYLINPATNLKLLGSFIYRDFNPMANTISVFKESTTWVSLGIRSDIFNWYFDY
ncbi:gliding motility protein RemB [Flavobacterium sp. CYK-55]|uniref:gliding motility protein RemB n=1 Tax=Flavobacterium sp. CYK-55 TaxID=2835529 RepID=UPI001BCAEDB0|nr:gliding motility protein RemB [Flavobacterium sp. CYK-55]MBS7787222.1 gliding motility protein RemB [Flavobacterium sp. CYK-55]